MHPTASAVVVQLSYMNERSLTSSGLTLLLAGPFLLAAGESLPFRVNQVSETACCPVEKRFELAVERSPNGTNPSITVQGLFDSIDAVTTAWGNKALVQGTLPRGGTILSLTDLSTGTQEATLWNYGYWLSPSGRYLAYLTWYPRMISIDARKSILVLYDLARNTDSNLIEARDFTFRETPGLPIFPPVNWTRQSYSSVLDEPHLILSPVLWSADERQIVFVDYYDRQNRLVVISLSADGRPHLTLTEELDVMDFALTEKITEATRQELESRDYKLSILEMNWGGPQEVVFRPYPQYWLPDTVRLPLP